MEEFIRSFFHTPMQDEIDSAIYITWAGYRACLPNHCIGPRVLDNYKIVMAVEGSGYFEQEGKKYCISEGDVFVLFPSIKHYYYANPEDPWTLMWVSFNGQACPTIMNSLRIAPDSAVIKSAASPNIKLALNNIIDSLENNTKEYIFRAVGYLYILFSELLANIEKDKSNEPLKKIKDDAIDEATMFIKLNYYNPINVDMLCRHVNYSRSCFSRRFKMETGLSVPQYVNRIRLIKAKNLLENTNLSMKEIAKSVGFDDALYFSRVFKKFMGTSPIYYKKEFPEEEMKQMN